jgi:hypothetical protein
LTRKVIDGRWQREKTVPQPDSSVYCTANSLISLPCQPCLSQCSSSLHRLSVPPLTDLRPLRPHECVSLPRAALKAHVRATKRHAFSWCLQTSLPHAFKQHQIEQHHGRRSPLSRLAVHVHTLSSATRARRIHRADLHNRRSMQQCRDFSRSRTLPLVNE